MKSVNEMLIDMLIDVLMICKLENVKEKKNRINKN